MLLASLSLSAQVNDSCVHAITLPVNLTCISDTFSSVGATGDGTTTAPNPGCGFYQGGDVWFKFVVPASGNFRVEVRGISYTPQWALYTGVCGTMSRYLCSQLNGDKTITDDTLAGQTIHIRVFGYNTANGGNFRVCVWEPEIPVNNDCANAIALPAIGTVCTPDTFTNAYATGEGTTISPNPTCGFYQGADVWFTAVVPASGVFRVETTTNYSQNALYTGACGSLTQFACSQLDGTNTYVFPNLAGQTIYIRVFAYNSEDGGQFSICLWEPELPVNDSCANAIALPPITTTCTPDTFTNAYATPEGASISANPTCGFYQGADVWFTAVVPASGIFRLETTTNYAQTALYTGTCGSLTQFSCNQLDGGNTYVLPSLANQIIYIRVFAYSSEDGGQFSICLWEPDVPVNNVCSDAISLPVGSFCDPDTFTNAYATPDSANVVANPTCGFYQGGDVWFTFVVPASGNFRLEATTNNAQTALYTGTCGSFTQFSCNQLDGGNTYVEPSLAGQTVYLRVFPYSNEEGGQFTLCVWEPEIPANNNCADAFVLPVRNFCDPDTFTNAYATSDSSGTAPSPGCGFYQGGDVWFKMAVPQTGNLLIERQNISGVNAQFALYDGSCGNFSVIACAQLRSSMYISDTSLANDTVYLRVFNYNSEEGGMFSLCAYDTTCGLSNTYNVQESFCFGDTFMFGSRALVNSGFYTETFAAANLCDSIVNLQLSFEPGSIIREFVSVCPGDSYTFLSGQTVNNITSSFNDTSVLTSTTAGCDTFVVTTVGLYTAYQFADTVGVCPGSSYTFHDGTTSSNITLAFNHTSTLQSADGCDSVIVTSVEVFSTIITSISDRVCEGDSYTFPDGGMLSNIQVAVTDTSILQAAGGCDSLVVTSLTVDPVYWQNTSVTICSGDGLTFPDGSVINNITTSMIDTSSLLTGAGCDSTIVTEVIVNPTYWQTVTAFICPGANYTYPDGSIDTNINTTVIDTAWLSTGQQCDSVIVTTVQVFSSILTPVSVTVCEGDSYTFPDGDVLNNITMPVTDTSMLIASGGCDSIVITELSVGANYWQNAIVTLCSGDDFTFPDGSTVTNITSPMFDTSALTTLVGCDSTIVTEIILLPTYWQTVSASICPGEDYTFPDGITDTNITASIVDTTRLVTDQWCDSVIVTTLTVEPIYWQSRNTFLCYGDDYTFPDGDVITNISSPVTDTSWLTTDMGCDSVIVVDLSLIDIDTVVTVAAETLTIDSTPGATYQWIDCATNIAVAGATDTAFSPTTTGDYAVVVSYNGCSDTSSCYNVVVVGVDEPMFPELVVYPNPTTGELNIELGDAAFNTQVTVTDLLGKQVYYQQLHGQRELMLEIDGAQGIYLLRINKGSEQLIVKVIKY